MLAYVKSLFFHFITIAFVSSGERRRLINERFFWRLHTDTPHHANSFTLPTYFHTQSHTCTHTRTHALTHSHTQSHTRTSTMHSHTRTHPHSHTRTRTSTAQGIRQKIWKLGRTPSLSIVYDSDDDDDGDDAKFQLKFNLAFHSSATSKIGGMTLSLSL